MYYIGSLSPHISFLIFFLVNADFHFIILKKRSELKVLVTAVCKSITWLDCIRDYFFGDRGIFVVKYGLAKGWEGVKVILFYFNFYRIIKFFRNDINDLLAYNFWFAFTFILWFIFHFGRKIAILLRSLYWKTISGFSKETTRLKKDM